jgi:putative phage-type endonuclease
VSLTADQMRQRLGKVTASMVPEIVGESPYRGRLAAWLRITGRHVEPEQADDDPRAWGHWAERTMLTWYSATRGVDLGYFGTLEHPEHPWLLATPDAAVFGQRVVVEAKNVGLRMGGDWADGPPIYVTIQATIQMEVCDADACDVVVSIGGAPPMVHRLHRDRELGAALIAVCWEFYRDHVLTNDPPLPDEATKPGDVAELHPKHNDEIPEVDDPRIIELVEEYRLATGIESAMKQTREHIASWICAHIGQSKGLEVEMPDGKRVRCLWGARDAVVVKEHVRPAGRVLTVNEVKAKAARQRAA